MEVPDCLSRRGEIGRLPSSLRKKAHHQPYRHGGEETQKGMVTWIYELLCRFSAAQPSLANAMQNQRRCMHGGGGLKRHGRLHSPPLHLPPSPGGGGPLSHLEAGSGGAVHASSHCPRRESLRRGREKAYMEEKVHHGSQCLFLFLFGKKQKF